MQELAHTTSKQGSNATFESLSANAATRASVSAAVASSNSYFVQIKAIEIASVACVLYRDSTIYDAEQYH
jgi:hypothetical protein